MLIEENDVMEDSSIPEDQEEVVNSDGGLDPEQDSTPDETQDDEESEQTTDDDSQPQGNVDFSQFDENGVPWKNRAMEAQRKYGELAETLPQLIEESISKATSKKETPQYTIAQLESYAQENPEYRGWAEEEKAKIQQANYAKLIDEKLNAGKREAEIGQKRQLAYQYVYNTYPECFAKDSNGRIVFNPSNPLVKEIGNIMNDPEIGNNPRGLSVAADMAYARLSRANSTKISTQNKKLKSNLKKEQRKTLVGSGTNNVVTNSPAKKAMDRLSQTGNKKDAANAIAEILKAKGVLR